MAKNIPITARVSRGLFGQKAKEPVLNVGPAGVYGNNITKGDPSPTKMMSPLKQLKSSSAGDLILKGQATVATTTPGETKVIPGKTKIIPGKKYVGNENAWWNSLSPKEKQEHNKKKREEIANNPEYQPRIEQEPDKIEQQPPTTTKEPLKVFNEGDAKTSYWRRQDERSIAHSARKKKRADIKLAKLEAEQGYKVTKDDKGVETKTVITDKSKHVKEAKLQAKVEQEEAKVAGYKGVRDAAVKQAEQSTRIHNKIQGVYVDPEGEQVLKASQVGRSVSKESAVTQGEALGGLKINNSPTTTNTNPATGKPAGEMADTKSTDVKAAENAKTEAPKTEPKKFENPKIEEDTEEPPSPVERNVKGFFAKRSALKMKYFK
jgi:hypothetical protein